MAHKVIRVVTEGKPVEFWFHCPGCGHYHFFEEGRWTYNGNPEKPTFTPSLLCMQGTENQCHLYVTDGKIQFLGDCLHDKAGQIVEMEDEQTLFADMDRTSQ